MDISDPSTSIIKPKVWKIRKTTGTNKATNKATRKTFKIKKNKNKFETKPPSKPPSSANKTMWATNLTKDPLPFLRTQTTEQIAGYLRDASYQYYKGTPLLTDDMYDILRNYLKEKDPSNPALQEVGSTTTATTATAADKVKLPYWMGSLDKIREDEASLEKWKKTYAGHVVISDKLDGNSALLIYSQKTPTTIYLYSRGDGYQGQNIGHIIPYIQGIPKATATLTGVAIRGELIISKELWKTKGKGANARNAVAGVMHSKHPDKALASIVEFVAYEQLSPRTNPSKGLANLESLGFKTVWNTRAATSDLTMENLSGVLMDRRDSSPYEIDGIVVADDKDHNQVAGKNPIHAFAFKSLLTHEEAEVIVTQVEWNASKDGYLKPLVHFPAVTLAGASIKKATGFNAQFISQNKIGPGSRIVIIRSGDVIPHIHKILSPAASGEPSMPDQATMPWEWNATHVDAVLKDVSTTKEVALKRMTYFAEKMEMKGVSEGIVARMYAGGFDTIPKMIAATESDLIALEGFQAKSAAKVVKEIRAAIARADCLTFMHASNLFGRTIGSTKLKTIVKAYPKILEGGVPTEGQLSGITGIGPQTAKQFLEGLPEFFAFMDEIGVECRATGVASVASLSTIKQQQKTSKPSLEGQTFVFTGVRDKEAEAAIEARGGKVSTSVSGKTTMVIAKDPEELTGKVKAAKEHGVPVVTLEKFRADIL